MRKTAGIQRDTQQGPGRKMWTWRISVYDKVGRPTGNFAGNAHERGEHISQETLDLLEGAVG